MAGLIDSSLEELETHLRELKREVSRLEKFRNQLLGTAEDEPASAAKRRSGPSSFSPTSARRTTCCGSGVFTNHQQEALWLPRARTVPTRERSSATSQLNR
jgi:hypothetical protein